MKKGTRQFSKKALKILLSYPYTGNVREARNIAEYASNICQDDTITPEHLPAYIFEDINDHTPAPIQTMAEPTLTKKPTNWKDMEREIILDTLKATGGNKTKAAAVLGWGRTTLWRKIHQHAIM